MEKKDELKKMLDICFEHHFEKISKYYDFNLRVFNELRKLLIQINQNLIFQSYISSILTTNYLLERLLKTALIYHGVGLDLRPLDKIGKDFSEPYKVNTSKYLHKTITNCYQKKIINEFEKVVLEDLIKDTFRDAFSHADSSKILADFPENIKVYKGKFQENGEKIEVKMNPKKVPFLNAVLVEQFAKDNALDYYDFVFKLIFKIEKRFINKYNYVQ